MICLKNITKIYPGKKESAVKSISLEVKEGDVFGFLGPNGAGKTTTVKMIVGLLRATSGEICILNAPADDFEVKKKIGFLPEHPHFYQYLTGREFLHMCGELFSIPKDTIKERITETLKSVRLEESAWDQKIRTYSKGMQQRLGLAQALVNDPELVILDEPMSGLDPMGRKEVKDIILNLKKRGKTVFFNSHILADVEDLCNRIAILDRGEIVLEGEVKEVTKDFTIPLEETFVKAIQDHKSSI